MSAVGSNKSRDEDSDEFTHLTVVELAIEWRCSRGFIYKEMKAGRLGYTQLGDKKIISRREERAYVRRNSRAAIEEGSNNVETA
jgi:hypothetical protein